MELEFTAREALDLLLSNLRDANPAIADRARFAIDAGVDDVGKQDITRGRGKQRKSLRREYRQHRALTDSESIDAVLEVLKAHLVVHRKAVNSVLDEMKKAAMGSAKRSPTNEAQFNQIVDASAETIGQEKEIQIELVPESARELDQRAQVHVLKQVDDHDIEELDRLIQDIQDLTRFES